MARAVKVASCSAVGAPAGPTSSVNGFVERADGLTAGYAINNNKNGGGGGGSWARANATTDRDAPTDSQRAGDVSSKVVLTFNHS